jgi:hypothetical protein
MTEQSALDKKLHDLDEAGKLYEFFETVLKSTPQQADVASRTLRHKFSWSGVRLLWNGDIGEEKTVAVDNVERIREYLVRESFDFLLPKPGVTAEGFENSASIPADVLDAALSGSKTAEGKIQMILSGGNGNDMDAAARTALLLKVEHAKRDGANGVDTNRHGQTRTERHDRSSNPFVGLRSNGSGGIPAGQIVPAKMRAVESLLKAVGTAKAAAIAKSAGLRLDGTPIPEQFR